MRLVNFRSFARRPLTFVVRPSDFSCPGTLLIGRAVTGRSSGIGMSAK